MINHFTRRSFIGLSAVAAASLALAGCSSNNDTAAKTDNAASTTTAAKETPTVRLGTTNDGHIFNAIADAQGYLAEEGVNVEVSVFSSSDDAFQALFSGKVDVLSNNGTNLPLTHIASGQDLTIYAGYMITGCMPIIAKAGTKWNGVEDLLGKTIACSGNEFAVFGPLYDAGHTMDEVTTIVLSNHADRVEAVRSGKADYAICGTSQNYNISQIDEVEVMCYCSDITPDYSCCRVASPQKFLDENSEAVTAMLRAWLRAQDWYEANRDAYRTSVERAWNWMGEMGLFPDTAASIKIDEHIDTKLYKEALDACTEKYKSDSPEFYTKMNNIYAEYDA